MADETTQRRRPEGRHRLQRSASEAASGRGPAWPRPGGRPGGRRPRGGRKFFRRKKVCKFCTEKIDAINYKDVRLLRASWPRAARSFRAA